MLLRAIYFLKVRKNRFQELNNISDDTASNSVFTNKRIILKNYDKKIKKHPRAKYFLGIGLDLSGLKSSWIIQALKAIPEINKYKKKLRLLIIGPRNEGEIFNFRGHGFSKKNIEAIDLMSYSPLIKLGDMHELKYPDDTFDIVYAGWVIAYSENKIKAANELCRVAKNNKFIAIGWSVSSSTNDEIIEKRGYMIGSKERVQCVDDILQLFSERKVEVIFSSPRNWNRINNKNAVDQIILILQVKK